jgi:hypothetical protein
VPHLFHQQTKDLLVGSNKMNNVYRVRFTNWNNGKNEYFFHNEIDAQNYANAYVKYGYLPVVEKIYFEEARDMAQA